MTTKKELEELLEGIITSGSYESARKAKKLQEVWSSIYPLKDAQKDLDEKPSKRVEKNK
jgi:hypothetical protein